MSTSLGCSIEILTKAVEFILLIEVHIEFVIDDGWEIGACEVETSELVENGWEIGANVGDFMNDGFIGSEFYINLHKWASLRLLPQDKKARLFSSLTWFLQVYRHRHKSWRNSNPEWSDFEFDTSTEKF